MAVILLVVLALFIGGSIVSSGNEYKPEFESSIAVSKESPSIYVETEETGLECRCEKVKETEAESTWENWGSYYSAERKGVAEGGLPTKSDELERDLPGQYAGTFFATRYGGGARYGDSIDYNGSPLGCVGEGSYNSEDTRIVAIGYESAISVGCGTKLRICSEYACLDGERVDTCPGCGRNHLDLSESGIRILCGGVQCDYVEGLTVEIVTKTSEAIE